jgi:hypothetical protein
MHVFTPYFFLATKLHKGTRSSLLCIFVANFFIFHTTFYLIRILNICGLK